VVVVVVVVVPGAKLKMSMWKPWSLRWDYHNNYYYYYHYLPACVPAECRTKLFRDFQIPHCFFSSSSSSYYYYYYYYYYYHHHYHHHHHHYHQDPPIYTVGCAARVVQIARPATQEYFQYSILVQVRGGVVVVVVVVVVVIVEVVIVVVVVVK